MKRGGKRIRRERARSERREKCRDQGGPPALSLIAGFGRVGPGGAGELDGHHGAVGIDGALFSDEGWGWCGDGPHLNIWRLLTDEGRNYASEAAKFDFDFIMDCLASRADERVVVLAQFGDDEFDDERLGCGYHHRDCFLGGIGAHVFYDERDHAVGEVGRQLKTVGSDLLFAIFACGTGRDSAAARVDEDIHGMRKERPLLNMVVGDELEDAVLRENRGFIVDRAIFEGEERS